MSVIDYSPSQIISGGQTGADQGGLRAALRLGIPTGGMAPSNYWTEDGSQRELLVGYGLTEGSGDYLARTIWNVEHSDATLIFGRRSRGSNRTEESCRRAGRPCLWVDDPLTANTIKRAGNILRVRVWLAVHQPPRLNIAGNRESVTPGIGVAVENLLVRVFA